MHTIHVTGASGTLASSVLRRIPASQRVTASSRTLGTLPDGSARLHADFDDPASLDGVFRGTDVLFLVSAGQGEDDTVIARHGVAIDAAEAAGVPHIVYTSLPRAADHVSLATAHRWTENRLRAGSADFTILRNGLYAELSEPFVAEAVRTGVLRAPFGTGRWSAVVREDLADVAAKVLIAPGDHIGRVYELVGDEAISGDDVAEEITRAGRPVRYAPVALADLRAGLTQAGTPPWQVPMVVSVFANITGGFLGSTESDLASLLDAPPRRALGIIREVAKAVVV